MFQHCSSIYKFTIIKLLVHSSQRISKSFRLLPPATSSIRKMLAEYLIIILEHMLLWLLCRVRLVAQPKGICSDRPRLAWIPLITLAIELPLVLRLAAWHALTHEALTRAFHFLPRLHLYAIFLVIRTFFFLCNFVLTIHTCLWVIRTSFRAQRAWFPRGTSVPVFLSLTGGAFW